MKKMIFLIVLIIVMTGSAGYGAKPVDIPSDVAQTHWVYGAVQRAAEDGWLVVADSGRFSPEAKASRREVALMLTGAWSGAEEKGRAVGSLPEPAVAIPAFSDMGTTDAVSQKSLKQLIGAGVLSGYPEGLIKPEGSVTRLEMAVMLSKICKAEQINPGVFADQSAIPQWGEKAAERAVAMGLISGYADGTFRPLQPVTRAEAVQMIGQWVYPQASPVPVSRGQVPVVGDPVTADILRLINAERSDKGLGPLRINQTLVKVALYKASAMANGNYFSHTSPEGENVETLFVRLGVKNWSALGENLLKIKGTVTAEKAVAAWMQSEGHRDNILTPYTDTGIGFARAADGTVYITQAFAAFR